MLFIKKRNHFKFFKFNQTRFQSGDLYKILEVDPKVSEGDLKKKYFELAKKYHPDVNPSKDAKSKFIEINNAYEILSNKQKRAQYDEQRQYGGFSRGFQTPPNYQSYQPRNQSQGKAGYSQHQQRNDSFDDIMRFWNEMVREENLKGQFKNQQSGYSSNYQSTTIKRDAHGNIRVETNSRGGRGNDFNWKYDAYGGENLRRARGGKFENIFENVFRDPWKIFTNANMNVERPTIFDFPSKFSMIQVIRPQENSLAQFQVGDFKNRQIGEVVETSKDRLTFSRNSMTLSTARFWPTASGDFTGSIEDKNGKKIATITQTNQSPVPSLVAALMPFMVNHYVIKNQTDKIIGYVSTFNFIFSSTVFYNKGLSVVVRVRGAMNIFGFNLVEYSDVSIGIGSTFDPSVIVMFTIWNTLKRQRSQNATIVKGFINTVLDFGKKLLAVGTTRKK